jgi:hypothetical protein
LRPGQGVALDFWNQAVAVMNQRAAD